MPNVLRYWYVTAAIFCVVAVGAAFLLRQRHRSVGVRFSTRLHYVIGNIRLALGARVNPLIAAQFGLRRYASARLATFPDYLLVPSLQGYRLSLDGAYIRLSLAASPLRKSSDGDLVREGAGVVLIFGEPGSGKSSLTRKLFRELCKAADARPRQSRLPIHVELNSLPWRTMPDDEAATEEWLLTQVLRTVQHVSGQHLPDYLCRSFRQGPGLVIFLDGMDEITTDYLAPAAHAIAEMSAHLRQESTRTTVIVTARTQLRGSLPRSFQERFDQVLTVEPFSPADIFAFLRRWPFRPPQLAEAQRVFEELRNKPTLFDMCTNPLVLGMYVAQDQRYADVSSGQRLPDTRPDFYKEVVGELLFFRREEKLGRAAAGTQLRRIREQLLGEIALDHLVDSDDPANSLSFARAIAVAERLQQPAPGQGTADKLRLLSVDTGIFAEERRGESLRFMHLTFCEFLAAVELSEGTDERFEAVLGGLLTSHSRRLWETVSFALALIGRDRRRAALQKLRSSGCSAELILRCVRESQAYQTSVFADVLAVATDELSSLSCDDWDAEWFARVRLVLSCLADAKRFADVQQTPLSLPTPSTWIKTLAGTDRVKLDRVFDLYLAASPAEALHAAEDFGFLPDLLTDRGRIVAAMEQPDLVGYGMHLVTEDPVAHEQWASLLAEAALTYELVARTLVEEPIPPSFHSVLQSIHPARAWHAKGPVASTLFGAILALVARPRKFREAPHRLSRVELISAVDATAANTSSILAEVLNLSPRRHGGGLIEPGTALAFYVGDGRSSIMFHEADEASARGLHERTRGGKIGSIRVLPDIVRSIHLSSIGPQNVLLLMADVDRVVTVKAKLDNSFYPRTPRWGRLPNRIEIRRDD